MGPRPGKAMRSCTAALAMAALLSGQVRASFAQSLFGGGGESPVVAYCAAERAPLVDLNNQYDEIQRSRVAQSVKNGAVAAAGVLVSSGLLGNLFGGSRGGPDHGPGLNPGSIIFGGNRNGRGGETAAAAIVAALSVSVATYISLKGESDDRKALARAIEQDAGGQIPLGRTIVGQAKALADCRARQVDDFKMRQAAASDADRRKMKREGDQILAAIKADIALTDKVVGHQADLAKTFTQARAMADNHSEADVLGGQKPAYADAASTTPLNLPEKSVTATPSTPSAPQPPPPLPPPPEVTLAIRKASAVRETPTAKGKLMMTLPAGREIKAVGLSAVNGWWRIDVAGSPGYIRELTVSVKTMPAPPPPPPQDRADNVREYNKVVLEARDEGPDRMRTLLTSFQ